MKKMQSYLVKEAVDPEERKLRLKKVADKSRNLRVASGMAHKAGAAKKSKVLWLKHQQAKYLVKSKLAKDGPSKFHSMNQSHVFRSQRKRMEKKYEAVDPLLRTVRMRKATGLLSRKLKKKYPGIEDLDISARKPRLIHLRLLQVARAHRKSGVGSKAMKDIASFADRHKSDTTLELATPGDMMGTTSVDRLHKFYSKFGFRSDGTNYDGYVKRKVMLRKPK